jgi:hypothetical protein
MAAGRSLPEFSGDELVESYHVSGKFSNTFRGLLSRHRFFVNQVNPRISSHGVRSASRFAYIA